MKKSPSLPELWHSCTVSAHSCNLALYFSKFDVIFISSRVSVCCRTFRYVPLLSLSHGCLCTHLFDGYIISPPLSINEFLEKKKSLGNKLVKFEFYDGEILCTKIIADFTDETLSVAKNRAI